MFYTLLVRGFENVHDIKINQNQITQDMLLYNICVINSNKR